MKMPTVVGIFIFISKIFMKFSLLINMKMPTVVGIFMFISSEIFMLSFFTNAYENANRSLTFFYLLAAKLSCSAMFNIKKTLQFLVI